VAAAAFVTTRHDSDAPAKGKAPSVAAPGKATAHGYPIIKDGVISIANAERDVTSVPAAVDADKLSVVAIVNYSNRKPAGMAWEIKSEEFGTGYVLRTAHGKTQLMTAAHAMAGSIQGGDSALPNFAAVANVRGQLEEIPIKGRRVPAAYDSGNTLTNDASLDLAIAEAAMLGWQDAVGDVHAGENDFKAVPAMTRAQHLPPVGSVVYQLSERTGATAATATWILPPASPMVAADIVIGYEGTRVLMVPENQTWPTERWQGGSGGPVVVGGKGPESGEAFGTSIEGGAEPENQFASDFGMSVAGYGQDQTVHYNIATIDTASALSTVSSSPLEPLPMPGYYP